MAGCVIFGGTGFIGLSLARYLLAARRFEHVHLADIRAPVDTIPGVSFSLCDVRQHIPESLAQFECKVHQVVEAGDHAIFLGEVVRLSAATGKPLLYFDSGYQKLP